MNKAQNRAGRFRKLARSRDAERPGRGARTGPRPEPADLLAGRNPLRELLLHDASRIEEVLVSRAGEQAPRASTRQGLIDLVQEKAVPLRFVSPDELDKLAGTASHQGFCAVLREREMKSLKDVLPGLEQAERAMVVLLDEINDPHNFGAILRACECFGIDAVVHSKNRGSRLTPVVTKSSAGASELVSIVTVSNLAEAARRLRQAGFWLVAAEAYEGSRDLFSFDFPPKTALILGSEGAGIQELLRKEADFRVKIPLCGRIDSLNVSQAAAVMLYVWRAAQSTT